MFGNRITLFQPPGFEVKIDSSWIILAILITWSLAKGVFPAYFEDMPASNYWAMGVAGALGLFLVHHPARAQPLARGQALRNPHEGDHPVHLRRCGRDE